MCGGWSLAVFDGGKCGVVSWLWLWSLGEGYWDFDTVLSTTTVWLALSSFYLWTTFLAVFGAFMDFSSCMVGGSLPFSKAPLLAGFKEGLSVSFSLGRNFQIAFLFFSVSAYPYRFCIPTFRKGYVLERVTCCAVHSQSVWKKGEILYLRH